MSKGLSVLVMLACFACNSGGDDCPDGEVCVDGGMIILPAGGAGGDGEGGQGGAGEGGQGGAGEGGQGGAGEGGQGGAGEGGQGGAGEGGQGGAGEGGMGGEGGGCTPMCEGLSCGPDGCGGECGPGCGDAQVCADGVCMAGECPEGTFECGGNCANLLTDPNNCGSCGKSCADEWPQQWTDEGFTYESANIEAVCAQAECSFMCAESETGPNDLIEDAENCGACGNVCDSGAVNSVQEACVQAQCFCVLTPNGEDGVLGNTCGDRCTVAGVNCGDGCCPEVEAQNAVPANNERAPLSFRLDLPRARGVEILPNEDCDDMQLQLVRYDDNGLIAGVASARCEAIRVPILAPGHYGVVVNPDNNAANSFRFSAPALEAEFVVPGESAPRTASANLVGFSFRAPEAGPHRIEFFEVDNNGNCDGAGGVFLLNSEGEVVETLREVDDCVFDLSAGWDGELAAGTYAVIGATQRLSGPHAIRVARTDIEPEPEPGPGPGDAIDGSGIYPFAGFGRDGSATLEMTVVAGGPYTLTTAGPGGNGCPADTILTVLQNGRQVARNDDAQGVPGNCSRLTYDFDARVPYEIVVSGYSGGAVGDGTVVVTD